ncbi:thiamine biosynthesis protein ThiS [Thioclava sp. SK-1]|uniref:sulfur carrier protein ThiS n=1 Tax=Thioclava sp. SK-1 TaxID=1889770 RepID=UPI0008241C34|nr:sulfur carrier protein ThiS [Thioclava sp. SK-1]OCX61181.1 thiamine biosynthesis protein ThiS [Thioclava sp. SK-1]
MRIELNGASVTTDADDLAELIEEQGFAAAHVATALNGEFVPRGARANTPLRDGVRIEVLSPMQGG